MTTLTTEPQSNPKPRILLSAVLLAAYVMIVAWVFNAQSMEWPHEGSVGYVVFFLFCPGIAFQSFNLAYMLRSGRRLTRRALTRLVTIPLGLVMAAFLANWASMLAMSGFEQAYVPFVTQVRATLSDPCRDGGRYFQAPAVTAYNLHERPRPAKLHHDSKRFVLAFQGGSADIDGSTIYYDSGPGTWRKFHNDSSDDQKAYAGLTAELAECVLAAK